MRQKLQDLLTQSLSTLYEKGLLTQTVERVHVEHTKENTHGDFASNIALALSARESYQPRQLAQYIINHLPSAQEIEKVEIAGPGFINFFISQHVNNAIIKEIIKKGDHYGKSNFGNGKTVLIEFVSANPTGPLHVGHGRGAAYGASVANLLKEVGFSVDGEYYINDAGRQIDILTLSVYLRYLQILGASIAFPDNAYQGSYIQDIARNIADQDGGKYRCDVEQIFQSSHQRHADKELYIDSLIDGLKALLKKKYHTICKLSMHSILTDIKQDLSEFGVRYQRWFSEASLGGSGLLKTCVETLQNSGYIYQKNHAFWFRTTDFGDEKDRVVIRGNGVYTYFATDIAYHLDKLNRGYDKIINVWGADHHGYIARVKAAIKGLGQASDKLEVLLVQFANLYRGGQKVAMSTRSGSFVTLRELRGEVGNDAARFFYILRKSDQHMDFDLDLAKSKTNENPVFYIQYAHARICSVLKKSEEDFSDNQAQAELSILTEDLEKNLIKDLNRYQEIVTKSALNYEPHLLAYYLRDLAEHFHTYYNSCEFLVSDEKIRTARLLLIIALKQIFKNGLALLGVNAPESM